MTCPDCSEDFPSEVILHRHRMVEHRDAVAREDAERAERKTTEDDPPTPDDGFLPSVKGTTPGDFLHSLTIPTEQLPPWERERIESESL